MTQEPVAGGTCAVEHCRAMPDTFCRQCIRWYCREHANHADHVTSTARS